MYILRLSVAFALLEVTFGQLLKFCGQAECRISTLIRCEDMVRDYTFQGSCCSLKPVTATNGCLIIVGGDNNCAWFPKCGTCATEDTNRTGACLEYQSESAAILLQCPAPDVYDVLNEIEGPTAAGALAPTLSPTAEPTCPPTSRPTLIDENVDDSAGIVVQGLKGVILSALATFFLF